MTSTTNLGLTQYAAVDKINFLTEYNVDMGKIDTSVGKLSTLTTTNKTSVVNAINEIYDRTKIVVNGDFVTKTCGNYQEVEGVFSENVTYTSSAGLYSAIVSVTLPAATAITNNIKIVASHNTEGSLWATPMGYNASTKVARFRSMLMIDIGTVPILLAFRISGTIS